MCLEDLLSSALPSFFICQLAIARAHQTPRPPSINIPHSTPSPQGAESAGFQGRGAGGRYPQSKNEEKRSDVLFLSICVSFVVSFVSYVVTIGVGWWFAREIDRENRLMFAGAVVFSVPVVALVVVPVVLLIGISVAYGKALGNHFPSEAVTRPIMVTIVVIIGTAFVFEIAGSLNCMQMTMLGRWGGQYSPHSQSHMDVTSLAC